MTTFADENAEPKTQRMWIYLSKKGKWKITEKYALADYYQYMGRTVIEIEGKVL